MKTGNTLYLKNYWDILRTVIVTDKKKIKRSALTYVGVRSVTKVV
jgi:hypothetical protein